MKKIINDDCMNLLPQLANNYVDFILTDIPYNVVNRDDNGLRTKLYNKDIKTILTKELFECYCYKVEDDIDE